MTQTLCYKGTAMNTNFWSDYSIYTEWNPDHFPTTVKPV